MNTQSLKQARAKRRKRHVRRTLSKAGPRVRLSVTRSLKHISAQIVDESTGSTVCGVGSMAKRLSADLEGKSKMDSAAAVGREIARLAKEKGVDAVSFDRGRCKYHGRVKALAEAAREGGLKF